jgi:predicted ribosome quality control (RQC) complex YloA/Tae2 family protein
MDKLSKKKKRKKEKKKKWFKERRQLFWKHLVLVMTVETNS